ncbi:MAG: LysR substrate-binding domain-containing protein [Pseudomonadota bacterium]
MTTTRILSSSLAAPQLFEKGQQPMHPSDLARYPLLSYSATGERELWEFARNGTTATVRAGGDLVSNNGDFLYALARQARGICLLPNFITESGVASGQVVPVCGEWTAPPLWLTLFYPPYEQLPPLVATFADYFEAYALSLVGGS